MAAEIVDGHALVQLLWVGAAAGTVMTLVFSLAIVGVTRSATSRRAGHAGAATAYGLLGGLCVTLVGALVVLAVVAMLDKG